MDNFKRFQYRQDIPFSIESIVIGKMSIIGYNKNMAAPMNDFAEYKRLGEPDKLEKSEIWQTAIGLQQVDRLKTSAYLIETAKENIEGNITFFEVRERLNEYYVTRPVHATEDRTEEADKVSARIAEILSEKTFSFSPAGYRKIHERLFAEILDKKTAGKFRDYNITKDEWVLHGETVYYASAGDIVAALDYDFAREKLFKYKGLDKREVAEHIAQFISGIWQIHAFGEGNTRATAVFTIKYLRTLGFEVDNDLFTEHSWYFRNALVRANYNDVKRNVNATMKYLNLFFGNLLLGEKNALKNREMQVTFEKNTPRKHPKKNTPEKHPKKTPQEKHPKKTPQENTPRKTPQEQENKGRNIGTDCRKPSNFHGGNGHEVGAFA